MQRVTGLQSLTGPFMRPASVAAPVPLGISAHSTAENTRVLRLSFGSSGQLRCIHTQQVKRGRKELKHRENHVLPMCYPLENEVGNTCPYAVGTLATPCQWRSPRLVAYRLELRRSSFFRDPTSQEMHEMFAVFRAQRFSGTPFRRSGQEPGRKPLRQTSLEDPELCLPPVGVKMCQGIVFIPDHEAGCSR